MGLFQHIGHFFAAFGLLLSSSMGHHQIAPHLPSQQATLSSYTASGQIQDHGYTVNVDLTIPKDGGSVTGTFSGDCNGNITGQYDGNENGVIQGQATGTCHVFFLPVPGSATFTGTVNKIQHTAQLQGLAKAASFEESQTVNLSLH